ncbi:MAG: hydroxymethylbilane synthase [Eubacteriales bacterium]|nr:hydroxymethylbilane synthase [Eubacteriales bacterium]
MPLENAKDPSKLNRKLVIGTRDSRLAIAQTQIVADYIRAKYPSIELELLPLKTTGDKLLGRLDKVGGKGLFVKELDEALRLGRVDLTVHSLKDVPSDLPPDLPLIAFSQRRAVEDVLVLPESGVWDQSKAIGTSSQRRKLQMLKLYPNCRVEPIRGNIITRLEKLETEGFGALILARAGLERINLAQRIARVFSVEEMIPAAGQGVLAVQARADFDASILEGFNCPETEVLVRAERAFVQELAGGCSSATCCHASLKSSKVYLNCLYSPDNQKVYSFAESCAPEKAEAKAREAARKLKKQVRENAKKV